MTLSKLQHIKSIYIFLLYVSFLFSAAYAQTIIIKGFVKEKGTHESLPNANILLKGTTLGTTTDTSGYFTLKVNPSAIKEDTLVISSLGYFNTKISVSANKERQVQVELTPEFFQLQEFTVKPGENPAWHILRAIIANKKNNNPDDRVNYSCQEYSKNRFDLNHFTEKIKKNILVRPFKYIWNNTDTTTDGVTYLPVLLVEKTIDHYYKSSPKQRKDYLNAVNTTGLAGPKIMQFVEDLYQAPNFYDNYIVILDKNFPSPLNDNYKNNYRFYLMDSTGTGLTKTYKINFRPKQSRDLAFIGEMLIDSTSFALKDITVRFDIRANVNFVRSFLINQKYEAINGKYWMLTESNVVGDFTVVENSSDLTGFFGRKNATFHNYVIDSILPKNIFKGSDILVEADSAKSRTNEYWQTSRQIDLSAQDKGVLKMDDSLQKDPKFILRKNIISAFVSGYYPTKSIDIGNFYSYYSYNVIEHSRVKLGFRTNEKLNFPLATSAYVAYGTFDKKWKYYGSAVLGLGKQLKYKKRIGASYRNDISQLSRSFNNIELDNILSSFIQVGSINPSRNYTQDVNAYLENNWTTGIVTRLNYFYNSTTPTAGFYFSALDAVGNITHPTNYYSSGLDLTFKYSWQNKNISGNFYDKNDVKNSFRKFPDFAIQYKLADKSLFGSEFNFQKVKASIKQQIRVKKLGYFKYYIEAGKTFGTVPYPYLDIPSANQLVILDEYAFNLMNFLEYASDQYVSAHIEQHIEGLILDRIPLINKLKWRNFLFAKGYFGKLSTENAQSIYLFPQNLHAVNNPYYEVGFGIENIFKIARIDFIWRLTDIHNPNVYYFMVKPSFKFSF